MTSINKAEKERIEILKQEIEKLVAIYESYLYKLKEKGWNFNAVHGGIHTMQISQDVLDNLWKIQKNLDITFKMPIPANLGEYYGNKFERVGKMVPGLHFIYEDLNGKEVNWHQILIYREGELTPYQRYLKNREEKERAFEAVRQEEINNTLNSVKDKVNETGRQI